MKRMMWGMALALLPVLLLATPVEDSAGLEQLRTAAERGDSESMLELGILYEFGFRMQDHNAPALAWYRLAAEAGNPKAGARHDALKGKMSAKDVDEVNKLYAEYAASVRKPAPSADTTPVSPVEPANLDATPKTESAPSEVQKEAPAATIK